MGATLPVLARFLSGSAQDAPRETGRAYAINTFGGVAGTLAAGFWLIPALGLQATTFLAAALNLAVAAASVALARTREGALRPGLSPGSPPRRLALAVSALSGFASLLYEVAWSRALILTMGSTVYAFTVILAAFILGLACGSALAARRAPRVRDPVAALGIVQAAIGIAAVALFWFLGDLPVLFASMMQSVKPAWGLFFGVQSLLAAFFVLVPAAVIGSVFPLACRLAVGSDETVGRSVGAVYTWNTVGCIAGSFAGSFLLVPGLGPGTTVLAAASVNLLLGAWLLATAAPPRRAALAAPIAAVVLCWLLPGWSPKKLSSGVFLYGDQYARAAQSKGLDLRTLIDTETDIVAGEWDSYGLVTVHRETPSGRLSMRINGKTDASTGAADMVTQLYLGHIPLAHHPSPKRVTVIGLGGGITLGAVLRHPVESVECVELSPAVARAAEHFRDANGDALRDARVRLVLGDGRNALAFGREPRDVVISEPSNLWLSGMANLFTRDFLEQAARRLAPGGLFCQWIHAYRLSAEDFKTLVRTFYGVFPHGSFWEVSPATDYILLGSMSPLLSDYAEVDRRLSEPRVRMDFDDPSFPGALGLLGHLVTNAEGARGAAGPGPVLTDDRCAIEFTAPRALYRDDRAKILPWLDRVRAGAVETLLYEGLDRDLERRLASRREGRRLVAEAFRVFVDRPAAECMARFEAAARSHGRDRQTQMYLDQIVLQVCAEANRGLQSGDVDAAVRGFSAVPRSSVHYPVAQVCLGNIFRGLNRHDRAREYYLDATAADPDAYEAWANLGAMQKEEGRFLEAVMSWDEALRIREKSVPARVHRGYCLLKLGNRDQARQEAKKALDLEPGNAEAARLMRECGGP
jgi:spermidine synthase